MIVSSILSAAIDRPRATPAGALDLIRGLLLLCPAHS
jgi:hypothetical protein